jgi:hypothetical protein
LVPEGFWDEVSLMYDEYMWLWLRSGEGTDECGVEVLTEVPFALFYV